MAASGAPRPPGARILEARAQVTITRSFQFPELNGSGSAPYSNTQGRIGPFQFPQSFTPSAGLDLAFEIDFWGRFRRATEAARADLLATEAARRVVMSTLVSDVAAAYLSLRSLDEEREISVKTLDIRRDALKLVMLREQGGVAALIDVRQSEVLVAQAAESVPDAERLIAQTENALAVLLGRNPEAVPRGRTARPAGRHPSAPHGLPVGPARAAPGHHPGRRPARRGHRAHRRRQERLLPARLPHGQRGGRGALGQQLLVRPAGPVRRRSVVHGADLQLGAGRRRRGFRGERAPRPRSTCTSRP